MVCAVGVPGPAKCQHRTQLRDHRFWEQWSFCCLLDRSCESLRRGGCASGHLGAANRDQQVASDLGLLTKLLDVEEDCH